MRFCVCTVFVVFSAVSAWATQQRSFVSSTGSDANGCTRQAPCRNFAAAVAQTNANGEVVALDSAGYGPVTITQSVSIVAPLGVHAAISVFSGAGVTINAPTVHATLRNLYINGQGGATGIDFLDGEQLHIDHCFISGFTGNGISLTPQFAAKVSIADTTVRECGQSGVFGDAPTLIVDVTGSHVESCQYGLAGDAIQLVARDTTVVNASAVGFYARGTIGSALFTLEHCVMLRCLRGAEVDSGTLTIHGGSITAGDYGVFGWQGTATLEGLIVTNALTAVYAVGTDLSIANSILQNGNYGIEFAPGAYTSISRTTIQRNAVGVNCSAAFTIHSGGDNLIDHNGANNGGCGVTTTPKI